jgi:D-serine deaminase-like pyridoxal phosphate-dependent protein
MQLQDLSTPAALVDTQRMARNIARMQTRMAALGVAFRPHVKTTKCLEIARQQLSAGGSGITVSTLKEAEQFFAAGVVDIVYAVGMSAPKLKQAAALMAQGCALKIIADSAEAARAIVDYGQQHGVQFEVWIEVDTDGHRSGVKPHSDDLLLIGRLLHGGDAPSGTDLGGESESPHGDRPETHHSGKPGARLGGKLGARLGGVMTHAGASYALHTPEALQAMAEQERSLCVLAAQRLRAAGLPCPNVSVGSTPTALSAQQLDGVTEVRAGVYVFFDLVMANVGVCQPSDIALSVLTTVIGHQSDKGWAIVDAGWMAMSRDRGTQGQQRDYGYGQVCSTSGEVLEGYVLSGANQEHGIVSWSPAAKAQTSAPQPAQLASVPASPPSEPPSLAQRFPIGMQLRILPNHACATAAQFPEYHAVVGQEAGSVWPRFYGW